MSDVEIEIMVKLKHLNRSGEKNFELPVNRNLGASSGVSIFERIWILKLFFFFFFDGEDVNPALDSTEKIKRKSSSTNEIENK